MTPITPPLQHPILMRVLPTAVLILKTSSPLTASYSIALSRRSSNSNELTKPNVFAAYAALHILGCVAEWLIKISNTNNTSSPTSDLDADIANCYANPQDLAADRQLLNRTYYLESPRIQMNSQNQIYSQHMRPSSLYCRAPQSAV